MANKQKTNAAMSVVAQAQERANVHNYQKARLNLTRLVNALDVEGNQKLFAVFPGTGEHPEDQHDLTELLKFPNLVTPLGEAFLLADVSNTVGTRAARISGLRQGFLRYLAEENRIFISLIELDRPFWISFIGWLNRPRATKRGAPLAETSRRTFLSTINGLLTSLEDHSEFGTAACNALISIPLNPWPGAHTKIAPTKRVTLDHLNQLNRVCEDLIRQAGKRIESGVRYIKDGCEKLGLQHSATNGYKSSMLKDLSILLAIIDQRFPGRIPGNPEDNGLYSLANPAKIQHGGWLNVCRHFQPDYQIIIPFIFWLARLTGFNPQTLTNLKWGDISELSIFGAKFVRIQGKKPRAKSSQVATISASLIDNQLGILEYLSILKSLTARLRSELPIHLKERLFIYASGVVAGSNEQVRVITRISDDSLRHFFRSNGIEYLTLKQVRPTVLDEVHLQTEDLIQATRVGQQKNLTTLWTHYTSDGTRKRYQEKLGEVYLLQERWIATKGTIDPRTRVLSGDMDRGAATPGFICLDPMDSPMPRQNKNRLCTAYGECPICPLAAARVSHGPSVALYLALDRSIYAAQGEMAPQSWLERWVPVLHALHSLLDFVPKNVLIQARKIAVTLPPVATVG